MTSIIAENKQCAAKKAADQWRPLTLALIKQPQRTKDDDDKIGALVL